MFQVRINYYDLFAIDAVITSVLAPYSAKKHSRKPILDILVSDARPKASHGKL